MDKSHLDASAAMEFFASPKVGIYSNCLLITVAILLLGLGLIESLMGLLVIAVGVGGLIVAVWMLKQE